MTELEQANHLSGCVIAVLIAWFGSIGIFLIGALIVRSVDAIF
jgi:hypothetical protein